MTREASNYSRDTGPRGLGNDVLEGCDVLAARCLGHILRDLGIGVDGMGGMGAARPQAVGV